MNSDTPVSFYTDLSKHHEFNSRLAAIINDPQSNISDCYLAKSTSDRFCLFIDTKNPNHSFTNIVFDFHHSFSRDNAYYLESGLSQFDIDNLTPFLADYTLTNAYEGLFFASQFFVSELNSSKAHIIYFKFSADEEKNQHLIDGKKFELKCAVTSRENLAFELKRVKKTKTKHANMLKCNTYSFQDHQKIDTCLDRVRKSKSIFPNPDLLVIEFYYDLEYLSSYIKSASELVGDELVGIDIEALM
jgi:hypothetical protein